jgi:FKBP-type peptidyl-prolyl cis-trans isomerase SlyD
VVTLRVELHDAQGVKIQDVSNLTYLHGGYGELFAALERVLEGKAAGESVRIQLEPEDAFGEYDADLLRVEPAERYGEGLVVGMEVEEHCRFYRVTDVADGQAVLDGNHPLAGIALRFFCEILTVRSAKPEELGRGVSLPQKK